MPSSPSTTTSSSNPSSVKEKLGGVIQIDASPADSSFVDLVSDATFVSSALLDAANEKGHTSTPDRHGRKDEAFEILASGSCSSNPSITYVSAEENDRIVKKIDRHLMPIMFMIYFLQLLDKQTLPFSSVFGISRDAHLKGEEYSLLGSILYIAQLIVHPIAAYALVRFRLSLYIPIMVTCWGITLSCMTAATNFPGLLISRFFLGGFEASVGPAFVLVGQIWYRRHEQGVRLAIWYSNSGFVNIFGSLIMFGLGHIKSHIFHSYQIVFLLLGLITFCVGIFSFSLLPDNPVRCNFLTQEEKVIAVERLRANQQGLETKTFKVAHVMEMICDLKSWCWLGLMFTLHIPSSGVTNFGPLILRGFGFDDYEVMLFLMPYGACQLIVIFLGFWLSKRYRIKSYIIICALLPAIAAAVILLRTGRTESDRPTLLAGYYLLSTYCVVGPLIVNWQSSNTAGHSKKTSTTALTTMGSVGGSIVGPLLFDPKDKPYYRRGLTSLVVCFSTCLGLTILTMLYLRYLNEVNRRRRIAVGKKADILDYSMMSIQEAEAARANQASLSSSEGEVMSPTGTRAFDDLTDLQNDEFIYVY